MAASTLIHGAILSPHLVFRGIVSHRALACTKSAGQGSSPATRLLRSRVTRAPVTSQEEGGRGDSQEQLMGTAAVGFREESQRGRDQFRTGRMNYR